MRVVVAADHAGFRLKDDLAAHLRGLGHEVEDLGVHAATSVDYPDFAHALATRLVSGAAERGVLVCGTGVGMAIAANRHPGVRAVNCSDTFTARNARGHNDANVLTLGERVVGVGLAKDILDVWLTTSFEGGRHQGRVAKIERTG